MIYVIKKAEGKDECDLLLSKNRDGSVVADLIKNKTTYSFKVDRTISEQVPEIVHIGFSQAKGVYFFGARDARESRSGLPFVLERNAGHCNNSISCFGSIWIPEKETDEVVCFFNPHVSVYFEGFEEGEYKVVNGYYSGDKLFADLVPSALGYITRLKAKRELLVKINELDSLAMIEAQLDLLTRYVLTGEGKETLSEAVNGHLVTTVHDDAKLKETISRQKAYLRELQSKYFKERGNFNNVSLST